MILDIIIGLFVSLSFAILFNAPKRSLIPIVVLGIGAVFIRKYMLFYGYSLEFSTFVAAFFIGSVGIYFSNKQSVPVLVYAISSSIVLVPTINAYKAMMGFIQISTHQITNQEVIIQTMHYGLRTWLMFGAITIGIVLPTQFISKYRFKIL
ncbi:threonine/serine exporter family protein [Sulfurimonas microaerophilic]|uniref:threonine/serine exporter family protein n=1 Tax=Sulfurimonas microaerophilic TaxID=3058392 RepID=UPI002714F32A|nr:threonine/serine exporter family protein [Sulfurimonas sp. hsl 1-7]